MLQVNYCGPEKESCVTNQTLKDKSCLVPCTGLYADIADDTLKQNMQAFDQNVLKGDIYCCFLLFLSSIDIRSPFADTRAGPLCLEPE